MSEERKLILWIAGQLASTFGPARYETLDPLENLVLTILSQNTNDTNRDRAYASMIDAFGTLDAVRTAPIEKLAESIRIGGLHQQKARSIHAALDRVHETAGTLSLAFLDGLALDDAHRWLVQLSGVGPKTAGIVLLFSFNRPVFPADTHIRRVMSRMGLVPEKGDPHPKLNALLPHDVLLMQQLHLHTIQLGRATCHPRKPDCDSCPLKTRCIWVTAHRLEGADAVSSAPE